MPRHKNSLFFDSEKARVALAELTAMVNDAKFMTDSSYSANTAVYEDHKIPFVDKHMEYLRTHPTIDPQQYIANLRLMNRSR